MEVPKWEGNSEYIGSRTARITLGQQSTVRLKQPIRTAEAQKSWATLILPAREVLSLFTHPTEKNKTKQKIVKDFL